jgi:hypothetical protein
VANARANGPSYGHTVVGLQNEAFRRGIRNTKNAPVAQLDRASGFEPEGWEFKSLRARHFLAQFILNGSGRYALGGFELKSQVRSEWKQASLHMSDKRVYRELDQIDGSRTQKFQNLKHFHTHVLRILDAEDYCQGNSRCLRKKKYCTRQ